MASNIQIQSFNQFLGAMIRSIIANTPLNDVNQGSVLLTILEAAAANDFENNAAILSLLNLLNIATVSGTDLDNRAADYGLTRYAATKASGSISIYNTSIKLQSTSLYILKPPPIASQTVLYVNNTTGWAASGTIYIGRGTISFEGPIPYSSITVYPTYSQINLSSALQNNHLISDTVVNSQGQPDRIIAAGTIVSIPANNQNPEIDYSTLRDAILPAGETEVDNVAAIAIVAGSIGNAPINTITQFSTSPFPGAVVANTSAFIGGTDVETDQELRDRINSYTNTLARGTEAAILAAVINVSDSDDNKQVASAIIDEPPSLGQPSILYIDDGTGFQPSYTGQSVDTLLTDATGKEQFLQLANFPVTRPQVVNAAIGPFSLVEGSSLSVSVDGVEETVYFTAADFVNISSAQVGEVVVAINNQAKLFSARLTNDSANILLYPDAWDAEIIQVAALLPTDVVSLYANTILQFPTSQFSFIALYQNSTRLREKTISAQVQTAAFGSWNITGPGDLIISVDGTPQQDRAFNLSNFPGASTFASLTLADWVAAFNQQFAGITATATSDQTMQITSNQNGSNSSLNILGGTLLAQLFPTQPTTSTGQTGQFILNRQTGNLEILTTIKPGDNITAGSADTKGFVISTITSSGNYNVSPDSFGRIAQMLIVADSTYCTKRALNAAIGSTLTISNPSTNVMRIMSGLLTAFPNLLPGDFVYITQRTSGWLAANNTGLFKIIDKGSHTTAGVDTYIDVQNAGDLSTPSITPQVVTVIDPADIQAFATDGYPQLWLGTFTPNPPVASITDIVNSINDNIINVIASVYESNSVKITSTTENNGSIAIPVVMGSNAIALFTSTSLAQFGTPPLTASIVSNKSLLTHFKIDQTTNKNTWLNRQVFDDSKGALTANSIPDVYPYSGPYSEVLQSTGELNTGHVDYDSIISFTRGNNKDQLRSIAAFLASDEVGTQEALARTSLDSVVGDQFEIVRPLQLSATDSIAMIVDQNPQQNTINIPLTRTGQVNSGNGTETGYAGGDASVGSFIPTTTELSATDSDNQPGIDFGNNNVWGTAINNTNFSDYAAWFRARNWYASGGVGSGNGVMIVRADEYGPDGNFLRFNMQYPSTPNQAALTSFVNTPSFTTFSYFFGSGAARATALSTGNTITVNGPYTNSSTNFPNGSLNYVFTVISANATAGATYTNNGQTFTVTSTIVAGTTLVTTGTGTPLTSGTLTKASGTGDATITFSSVATPGSYYDYTFSAGSLASVQVGDVISIITSSGVSNANSGQFSVQNISGNTIRVLNPNASVTTPGTPEVDTVTTTADVLGTPTSYGLTAVADVSGSLNGTYFLVYNTAGSVAVWINENSSAAPPAAGANAYLMVGTILPGDSASTVATKIAQAINQSNYFTTTVSGASFLITNVQNGALANANVGTSGFSVTPNVPSSLLASAANYGILGASAVTNASGSTTVNGNLGLYPGTSVTGTFVVTGATNINNAAAHTAQNDALAAYTTLSTHSSTTIPSALDGQTLTAGYYSFSSGAATLAQSGPGTLTFNGSATDIFVVITASTLTTGAGGAATIALTGGALASNVYFVVGSSATLNSGTAGTHNGNVIAQASITDTLGGTVNGDLIALTGAVTISAAAVITAQPGSGGGGLVGVTGTNNASLNGKYFIIYDNGGPVSVWFDVGNQGTPEPYDGSYRSIRVYNLSAGASANTVALAIQQAINGDASFGSPGVVGNVVTITNTFDGNVPAGNAGTSGFTVSSTAGSLANPEVINNPVGVNIFPLVGTSVSSIATTINASSLMSATAVGSGSLKISLATQEETSATLAYGFTPGHNYVSMYDGANWVKSFQNPNPNFTMKTPFVLQGAQPSVYSMDTAPNFDTTTNGELFKLIPTTVQNLYHQFTQPALSQLPIVTTVEITDDRRNVQIKSMQLGSAGAIEVLGGTGNQIQMYLESESEVETDSSGSYLTVQVPAFPDTFSAGDTVLLQNDVGVARLNRLQASDTVATLNINPLTNAIEYAYNPKVTGIVSGTSFTIVDVSSSYSIPAGFVWRWTATGSGVTLADVNPGDLIYAFGALSGWAQQNQAKPSGDAAVSGLPIIAVNASSNYVDVVNPFGSPMSATTVGSGTVQICPTPIIQWTPAHAAYVEVATLSSTSNVVSVTTIAPHFLNTGNSISLRDSTNIPDGVYTVTVVSATQLTFTYSGPNFIETPTNASLIQSTLTPSRYRLQSLKFNNLMRLNRQNGQSPSFIDVGVAVDDYLVLSGTTFASNNNGRFRVLAVDNDSIIFINGEGTDQLNTVRTMNNQGMDVVFTANANYLTGPVGAFKYIMVGDWVKGRSDPDTYYLQVLNLNNSNPALATQITLGGNYAGATGSYAGVIYRETIDYDQGVFLENAGDIAIYEGDAVVQGDTLYVQDIVEPGWFNVNNVGSFDIVQYGTEANYKPFLRVINPSGVAPDTGELSASPGGFYIIEGLANKFYTIREVTYSVLDATNSNWRNIYITPWSRSYKFTPANESSITHLGKIGYSNNVVIGIDGYVYYTGLLQKVQRIVDGFEPDAADYPGQRAVGSAIETLPPLPYQVNLALTVITNAGVNLGDVSNNIKSTIINYVESLNVGAPIVLSQIIADIQPISGVASVVFTNPVPSTQSITLANNEKAIISANNISIA